MKLKFNNLIVISVFFLLTSCGNRVVNYKEIEIETGKQSGVILITENDTLSGTEYYGVIGSKSPTRNYYFYRTGGIMTVEIFHPDSIKETRMYYRDGILETTYFKKTKNDIEWSHLNEKEYFPSGTLSKVSSWNEGIPIDTHWFYRENGTVIKYDVYDNWGHLIE